MKNIYILCIILFFGLKSFAQGYGGFIAYEFTENKCNLNLTVVKGRYFTGGINPCFTGIFDSFEPGGYYDATFSSFDLENMNIIRQDTFDTITSFDTFATTFISPLKCFNFLEDPLPCLKFANRNFNC